MEFKNKKDIGELYTTDIYYDIFEGYIKPEDVLVNDDDIVNIRHAINIVKSFIDGIDELIDEDD